MSIKTKYIQLRGNVFQFAMRVPTDLKGRYSGNFIRFSLKTDDPKEAMRLAEAHAKRLNAEFKAMRGDAALTPREVSVAAKAMADRFGDLDSFVDQVADKKRQQYAGGDIEVYEQASVDEFLSPVEVEALRVLQRPDELRLSGVLKYYEEHHPKGADKEFMERAARDWNKLMDIVGDVSFNELSRQHARTYVTTCLEEGSATSTVRRRLNQLRAITGTCINETGRVMNNPFAKLRIPGEGKDTKKRAVPSDSDLKAIARTFAADDSNTAMIILAQMETGTRIGDIACLAVDDVFLNHETPHIWIRPNEWRGEGKKASNRLVPLVGVALQAMEAALSKHPGNSPWLFPAYAKERGKDNASAAVKKRLKPWGITSHCFRHAMKDRLRNAGIPKDVRDAIQGHAAKDMDDHYGTGHALEIKREALLKVAIELVDGDSAVDPKA